MDVEINMMIRSVRYTNDRNTLYVDNRKIFTNIMRTVVNVSPMSSLERNSAKLFINPFNRHTLNKFALINISGISMITNIALISVRDPYCLGDRPYDTLL